MCGIIGIVGRRNVNQSIYDGLIVLQHRGQDAAGIVTDDNGHLSLRKDNGFVRDVFRTQHMFRLKGHMGIGHVRYPTAGCSSSAEAQPFYVNSPYGISLAHNGNLTNANELLNEVFRDDLRHINTESDSEILLNVFAHELQSVGKLKLTVEDIFKAVEGVHRRCKGGYAGVAMIAGYGIVGFRDPYGIRPVVFGKRETDLGTEYIIASESVAIDSLNFELIRDIVPGEAVIIEANGTIHTQQCAENPQYRPCIFEYVYFARPDSIIDGISVYKARLRMGEYLAKKIKKEKPDHGIDVVIPIPDTSRTSALRLSNKLRIKYREGFVKNRYIGRTFIMPGQQERKKSVRQKLNAIDLEFKGKNVLLVDDSIVRGTTSREIIQMAREAGAKKVFFASAAPPVRYANVYGIDMPSVKELVGHGQDVDQICKKIGADWLIYQDLDDLIASTSHGKSKIKNFDISVFDGNYVTGDVTPEYLNNIETMRSDKFKQQQRVRAEEQESEITLHNGA
ncbi:MAG: amidophosphoribosyltransferase [Gammaproteobacteria bacterium]|nr:amidophosphoribosyltransferase [Gammaproteobacteria bacterium]